MPLAEVMRPKTLDEICGQSHLLNKNAPFRRIIESGLLPSLIFYGPPGTGKTTTADILAAHTNKQFHRLNATTASLSDVREALETSNELTMTNTEGTLLYIDEIQYFNKKQQQSLLEYVEDGRVTLICSTTENPYFTIYGALLSRSTAFEFKPLKPVDILPALERGFNYLCKENGTKTLEDTVFSVISHSCGGDVRKALNTLENTYFACGDTLEADIAAQLVQRSGMKFDRDGNEHYDLLSAYQKSIRGSDENAAVFYLAKILEGGDLLSVCRRISVIASEDISLAYPMAAVITNACVESALRIGLPEAMHPLAEATILLATSPKSNSTSSAYWAATEDIANGLGSKTPDHLRDRNNPNMEGVKPYIYPHDFPNHYTDKQKYLPDDIKNKKYYTYGENKLEKATEEYWKKIK
ncbi:replication-associated recombination protein A [Eubacteriales bacterium OttesenSCG-928-G02]|nr:replication-associated recombination protein A [Eubacteriales bacterium OttesenSCG-928-G02]